MILKCFSVRDALTDFMPPVFDYNQDTATRGFAMAMNKVGSSFNSSPKDFDLYEIGDFDTETGKFICIGIPRLIISGTDAIRKERDENA